MQQHASAATEAPRTQVPSLGMRLRTLAFILGAVVALLPRPLKIMCALVVGLLCSSSMWAPAASAIAGWLRPNLHLLLSAACLAYIATQVPYMHLARRIAAQIKIARARETPTTNLQKG